MKLKVADASIEAVVAVARSERADYGFVETPLTAPEFLPAGAQTIATAALRDLFLTWGLDGDRAGTPAWNPLGDFIRPGSRVVIKPNWVLHWNQSGQGLDCLVTHTSVIEAVLKFVALARPSSVIIGDAPIQGCDFQALCQATGIFGMLNQFQASEMDLAVRDFRRTLLPRGALGSPRLETGRGSDQYVLVDLGGESLLEPISVDAAKFRVTMYDPEMMRHSHAPGRHQYLIAREVLQADVVVNLPKLKCHKKACITGALKNLVGINGNKEYLPHHRKGSSSAGGDCYGGESWLKRKAEDLADAANRSSSETGQSLLAASSELLVKAATRLGGDDNLEGSWYGNDTVWRTVLDLQRILRYARLDGTMAGEPQRAVVHITDAIIGGEGEGPLAPTPVASGFLTGAVNPAAAEWAHARLMGFDPRKIPLVYRAFESFPYPLADFEPSAVHLKAGKHQGQLHFRPPKGWRGHCELEDIPNPTGERALVA